MTPINDSKIDKIVIGIWFTIVISMAMVALVGLYSHVTLKKSLENNQVQDVLIVIPNEEITRVPSSIIAPFLLQHTPLPIAEISTKKTCAAVMISRVTLDEARANSALRDNLIQITRSGCILLVYDAAPVDLVDALNVSAPLVRSSSDTVYFLSSMVFVHNIPVIGGMAASSDNPDADNEIGRDIQAHVERVLLTIQELKNND